MANILLPILPGTLPQGACPTTLQEQLVLFANNMQALLANGRSFYNFGDTKPAPEFQAYPWLNTGDGRWYFYGVGGWSTPNNYNPDERRWWAGALTGAGSLEYYDGGSPGTVTSTSGPMWVVDTDFDAKFPVGPGTMPSGLTIAVGDTGGSETHTLTPAEGAVGDHVHPIGVCDPATDDAFLPIQGVSTVPAWNRHFITGGGSASPGVETTANLTSLAAGAAGAGVTPTPFSTLPPYRGLYCIKPSGRLYYVIP